MSLKTLSYSKSAFSSIQGGQTVPGQNSLVSDTNFPYVNLLLHGDATNSANNSTILDSSANNFTVSRTGTPAQGTNSPYSQTGWTGSFNNPDYLSTPAALNTAIVGLAGSTWTMEAWVYPTTITNTATYGVFGSYQAVAANGRWVINYIGTSNTQAVVRFIYTTSPSSEVVLVTTETITVNQWSHIALTIDATTSASSTIKIYVNGVGQTNTAQNLSTHTTNYSAPLIGGGTYVWYTEGYISNLRLVKNNIVYTTNFIVPTTPLTAVTGTLLLTLQSNRFVDNSSNNYAITVSQGNPSVLTLSPFEPSTVWSSTNNGGSIYFGGSDSLSIANNSAFNFSSGSFTVEAWVKFNAVAAQQCVVTQWQNATNGWALQLSSGSVFIASFNGNGNNITGSVAIKVGQWYHVAISGTTGSIKLFVNGVQDGATYTGATTFTSTAALTVGTIASASYLAGYISNLRIVNGTALYTGTFTPPSTPVTAVSNTALLLSGTNSAIYDSASKNNMVVVGDTKTMIAVSKFGSSSIFFDGTGDYMSVPYVTKLFDWWTSDYTLETWIYPTTFTGWSYTDGATSNIPTLIGNRTPLSNTNYWSMGPVSDGRVCFYYSNGAANQVFSIATCNLNQWNHIAVTKTSSGIKIWVNGTGNTVAAVSGTPQSSASTVLSIGAGNASYINGYVDDTRITKGIARYTSNFSVPTTPFPNY